MRDKESMLTIAIDNLEESLIGSVEESMGKGSIV